MQLSIVTRTTATGALCLGGAAACSYGFPQLSWLPPVLVGLGTVVFWGLGRTLRRQLTRIATSMESLSDDELDLSRRLPSMNTRETQRIVEAFGRHAGRVEEQTATARAMAASLADRALELSARVRAIEATTDSDPDNGSLAAELQAIAVAASTHRTLAKRILGEAHAAVDKLEHALAEVDVAAQVFTTVEEAGAQTIGAMQEIDEIAFQTNLVALNAAVEAAHAGAHARGFAVVVEEVRRLAARSAAAVKHNSAVLSQSVTAAQRGETVMRELRDQVPGLLEALRSLQSNLETVAENSAYQATSIAALASDPRHSAGARGSVGDATAAMGADALVIGKELGALHGEAVTEGIASVELPPHPLDWDQCDAETQADQQFEDHNDREVEPSEAGSKKRRPHRLDWDKCDFEAKQARPATDLETPGGPDWDLCDAAPTATFRASLASRRQNVQAAGEDGTMDTPL